MSERKKLLLPLLLLFCTAAVILFPRLWEMQRLHILTEENVPWRYTPVGGADLTPRKVMTLYYKGELNVMQGASTAESAEKLSTAVPVLESFFDGDASFLPSLTALLEQGRAEEVTVFAQSEDRPVLLNFVFIEAWAGSVSLSLTYEERTGTLFAFSYLDTDVTSASSPSFKELSRATEAAAPRYFGGWLGLSKTQYSVETQEISTEWDHLFYCNVYLMDSLTEEKDSVREEDTK
ncbi:MAG: hypothetical protein IJX82_09000 [Clostridia bacterium]|nr:hypothetical protein [Clostridia bacterium]